MVLIKITFLQEVLRDASLMTAEVVPSQRMEQLVRLRSNLDLMSGYTFCSAVPDFSPLISWTYCILCIEVFSAQTLIVSLVVIQDEGHSSHPLVHFQE